MSSQPKQNYQLARRSPWREALRYLVSDPWRKLIALLMAASCWFLLNLNLHRTENQRWETINNIPVTVQQYFTQGGNRYYFDSKTISPREISLAVAIDAWNDGMPSSRDFLVRLQPRNLDFTNDGLRTQPLEQTYTLTASDLLEKPQGVSLRDFVPATVTIQWDGLIGKAVPIHLKINDRLPENLSFRPPEVPPLHIYGPAYLVNQINLIETEPILLTQDAPGAVTIENVQLQLPARFAPVEMDRHSLSVTLEIVDQKKTNYRLLKELRLNYLTSPDSALALQDAPSLPRSLNIYVSGPAGVVDHLDSQNLMALCDLTGYSMQGPQDVPVRILNLPPEVTVTRILPSPTIRVVLSAPSSP